jgi:hypothetical protein
MNYFRRPKIANKSLPRLSQATIRGNTRRRNGDGVVSTPYFPDAVAGQDLVVVSQTGTRTYALISNKISDLIAGLNGPTMLPQISAEAFDHDGCLGIRSTVTGATSLISVTGGTAAAALGFNLGEQQFVSRGGDIQSAGEGRVGATFGSVTLNPGENLTTASINKALGRIAANTDVLYADAQRYGVVVKKLGTFYTATATTSVSINSLATNQKVYSGGQVAVSPPPALSASSTPAELARFFFLIDSVTGTPAACDVVDVTSTPNGTSVLGQEQQVLASTAITSIVSGSTVRVDGVNFTSLNVQPGDYVKILSSVNTNPWSNNGYKWAVEEVMNATHLSLRPLSASEQIRCGETIVAGAQPVLELNTSGSGFGNITITRGPWTTGAYLEVSPAIPGGAAYDVWAAVPANQHDIGTYELGADSPLATATAIRPDVSTLSEFILVAPTITSLTSNSVATSEFYVRSKGKVVRVPATSTTRNNAQTEYLYWHTGTNVLELIASWSGAFLGTNYLYIAKLNAGGNTYELPSRVLSTRECVLTVGEGQQFATLESAVNYARTVSGVNFYEILLCDQNTPVPNPIALDFFLSIRALTRSYITNDSNMWPFTGTAYDNGVTLENLTYSGFGLPEFRTAYPYVKLKNVQRLAGAGPRYAYAYGATELTWGSNYVGNLVGVTIPDIAAQISTARGLISAEIDTDIATARSLITTLPTPWSSPTLSNGFVQVSGAPLGYCKDSLGFVHFRGLITVPAGGLGGYTGYLVCPLPPGLYPPALATFLGYEVGSNGTIVQPVTISILPNGYVYVQGMTSASTLLASSVIHGLSSVNFYAG